MDAYKISIRGLIDRTRKLIAYSFAHPLLRGSTIVFVGSMATNVSGYLYQLLVGRVLGREHFGELASLLALFTILNVPSTVLQTILVKYFSALKAKNEIGQSKRLFIIVTRGLIFFEVILFVLLLPFIPYVASFLHIDHNEYFIWLYLIFASFLLGTINGSMLQAFQLFTVSMVMTNIGMLLRLILGVVTAYVGIGLVLLSNALTNFIAYILSFFPIRTFLSVKSEKFTLSKKHMLRYSFPTFLTILGMTSLYNQDVILVKHFFSPELAGDYSSLSILGKVIYFASTAVGYVLFPVVAQYKEIKKDYRKLTYLALWVTATISLGITSLYFLFPVAIIRIFWGSTFAGATAYLGLFGIFISFIALSSLLITVCLAASRLYVWVPTVTAALLQILLISIYHADLYQIIMGNTIASSVLFVSLLLYFAYEKKRA